MPGVELRRFVGGPFPNLVPDRSPARQVAGIAGGPFPNLVPRSLPPVDQPGTDDAARTATTDRTTTSA
jgi:hypothetical protein